MSHNPLSLNTLGFLSSGTGGGVDRPIFLLTAGIDDAALSAALAPPMVVTKIKKRELIGAVEDGKIAAFEVD